jgi:hypothetical protein
MPPTPEPDAFRAALRTPAAGPPALSGAGVPDWLWQTAVALHEHLPPDTADDWAARLRGALDGAAPAPTLGTAHAWYAHTVLPLLMTTHPEDRSALAALAGLHRAAAHRAPAGQDTWTAALHPVLLLLYDSAYDRAGARADAYEGAHGYALANGFSPADADAYGHTYAGLSTDANAHAGARAHASALAPLLAEAFAAADARAYAETFPAAQVRTVVRAAAARGATSAAPRLADALSALLAEGPPGTRSGG